MKRFLSIFLAAVILSGCFMLPACAAENMDTLSKKITEMEKRKVDAHAMAEAARALGYAEDHSVILLAKEEWNKANTNKIEYQKQYNSLKAAEEAKWQTKKNQYPVATEIWLYMKNLGYNDAVCAGILGNMMGEVGGNTLNIKWWLYGSGYYGICQWSRSYSGVWGTDLQTQLNFLRDTIQYEMNTYGRNYAKGFNYNQFLQLKDARQAALAFAKCYERGAAWTHSKRQANATVAYNYFVNN